MAGQSMKVYGDLKSGNRRDVKWTDDRTDHQPA